MSDINTRRHGLLTQFRANQNKTPSRWQGLAFPDIWLLIVWVMLIAIGMIMVTSSSSSGSVVTGQSPFYYMQRQILFYVGALPAAYIAFSVGVQFYVDKAKLILLISGILLILVYVPGIGTVVNGSRRWINLRIFNFQVGELVKLAVIIYAAMILQKNSYRLDSSWNPIFKILGIVILFSGLLLMQPDFGTTLVMVVTVFGMMFLAGVSLKRFVILGAITFTGMAVILIAKPYRVRRLMTFLDPFEYQSDEGYQLVNSLIAFGRGQMNGLGLGESIQKHQFLPEAHTDFIFAILGEEMGFRGAIVVMIIFALLVWRAFAIGQLADRVRQRFACNLAYGIGLWLAIQTLIHIGVTIGALPTKGLTLPLISYGGSSILVTCIALGILVRIDAEARFQAEREGIL